MARTAKTKSVSFTEEYFKEFNYLDNMKGASEYVCKLIRKDRLSKEEDINLLAKQTEELLMRMEALRQKNNQGESQC